MRNYLQIPSTPKSMWNNPLHFIAFGFGIGAIPFAPGTFATLFTIPFYLILSRYSWLIYLSFIIVFCIASMKLCEKISNEINVNDHQAMCLDEIIGFLFAMFLAPRGIAWIIFGVILFRFFDIVKPWPIRFVDEKIHGGFGMILDDVLAGIFSCVIIQLVAKIIL